ncbi:HDIG domain-containing protein [Paucidesulfovibrio gracilis DSM 16080]|uniref:HDIG domain-containing protein n=1 Tax=Paucidesulfovibrio gracilis DSM 16080 TaxID=1121449 RepID=A0A1T4WB74_9BACT|nr:HDOD domain-containing protein [Paucidesulfovibrio gracilis]SKA74546.1 HDIG domain-containing protein [Paucidesulfovibrio gracilis DSM 16080]
MHSEHAQRFLVELPDIRHDLPFSPGLMHKLFAQTGENSLASLDEVGQTISKDQGLTAKILAVANSAFYGLQARVSTVQRAASMLGMAEIRNIVVAFGVRALTRKFPLPKEFDLLDYWKHQFCVASIAKELGRRAGTTSTDNLFTAGLLHDLGKLITALYRRDDWTAILALAREKEMPFYKAEEEHWGLDHGVIGSLVLKSWDFPAELFEPVNWHHSPRLAGVFSGDAAMIGMADAIAHRIFDGVATDPEAEEHITKTCERFGLDPQEILSQAGELLSEESIDRVVHLLT